MKVKQLRYILGFLTLSVSFQNCGGSGAGNPTNSNTTSTSGTAVHGSQAQAPSGSAGGLNSGSAKGIAKSPSNSGATFGGISSGSAGSATGTLGGASGGSSGGTGGTCLGCGNGGTGGSGGTGGAGGTGTGGGTSGDLTFKIMKQPISKTVDEGYDFTVSVSVQGGKGPYKFNWFRDSEEVPPKYGVEHFESYSDMLDRIYKQGDYYVTITDATGAKLTSSKAQIRITPKVCRGGNYYIDLSKRTNPSDGYYYFNDLFYYKNTKYFVSQYNQTVGQMQLNNFVNYLRTIGFGYFKMNQDISNNQAFVLECSTDVPTIHTSECATNNLSKCYYNNQDGNYNASSTYEGGINFVCRNGYIEFVSNTCHLTTPTPPPDTGGGG